MNKDMLEDLRDFLDRASKATYAGGGEHVEPWRSGFKELEYREANWYYRDSYAGHLRSWGQEVVWYNDQPVWACSYGGGMTDSYMSDEIARETSSFLKEALLAAGDHSSFQPRGPHKYEQGDWKYECTTNGDIESFTGQEHITHKGKTVFVHDFLGGTIVTH